MRDFVKRLLKIKSNYVHLMCLVNHLVMSSKNSNTLDKHGLDSRNSCCDLFSRLQHLKCSTILPFIIVRSTFYNFKVRLIGVQLHESCLSPFLKIGIIFAPRQSWGTLPSFNGSQKIRASWFVGN